MAKALVPNSTTLSTDSATPRARLKYPRWEVAWRGVRADTTVDLRREGWVGRQRPGGVIVEGLWRSAARSAPRDGSAALRLVLAPRVGALQAGPGQRQLAGEHGDLALQLTEPAVARGDEAEEGDDQGVQEQVRAATHPHPPGQPGEPVREDHRRRCDEDEGDEQDAADRLVAGVRRRPGEHHRDHADPREQEDLDDDLVGHGAPAGRGTGQRKMRSTRMLTELSSDWPLARE